jgi:hypothetical protein
MTCQSVSTVRAAKERRRAPDERVPRQSNPPFLRDCVLVSASG